MCQDILCVEANGDAAKGVFADRNDRLADLDTRLSWSPNPAFLKDLHFQQTQHIHESLNGHRFFDVSVVDRDELKQSPKVFVESS